MENCLATRSVMVMGLGQSTKTSQPSLALASHRNSCPFSIFKIACGLAPSNTHPFLQPKLAKAYICSSHSRSLSLTTLSTHACVSTVLSAYIHLWSVGLVCPRRVDQPLLDVTSQAVEGLVDIDVALRRHLEEGNTKLVGEGLALFCRDGALLFPVALVADQDLVDAFGGVLFNVSEPCANI